MFLNVNDNLKLTRSQVNLKPQHQKTKEIWYMGRMKRTTKINTEIIEKLDINIESMNSLQTTRMREKLS